MPEFSSDWREAINRYVASGGLNDIAGDSWHTVNGGTVADIKESIENHRFTRLKPGKTYTNPDDTTIKIDLESAGERKSINAYGADISFTGTLCKIIGGDLLNNVVEWFGGQIQAGNNSDDIAFEIEDSTGTTLKPRVIRACKAGIVLRNEESWCERFTHEGVIHGCDYGIVALGNDASDVDPEILAPTGSGGTGSFRSMDLDTWISPDDGGVGFYNDNAYVYDSKIDLSMNLGTGITGWRLDGRYNHTDVKIHCETPGGASGGTGINVVNMVRHPTQVMGNFSGLDTRVDTTADFFYWYSPFDFDGWQLFNGKTDTFVRRYDEDSAQGIQLNRGITFTGDQSVAISRKDLTTYSGTTNDQLVRHSGDLNLYMWNDGQGKWVQVGGTNEITP